MTIEAPTKVNSLLKTMPSARISGLTWYFDSDKLLGSMPTGTIDDILDAYHRAYHRFCSYVFAEQNDTIPLTEFPLANFVLTENRDVFKQLYPNPNRFDQLPNWVTGYVNFKHRVHVMLFLDKQLQIDIDGKAHEFTHAIIPDAIKLPATFLDGFWPTWIHEAFTVGANQLQPIEWVRKEINTMSTPPTTDFIEEKGIFALDQRSPHFNPAYQYCVLITEAIGKKIAQQLYQQYPDLKAPPLLGVCDLTQRLFREGSNDLNFRNELQLMGINTSLIEDELQASLRS